jgi:hypothetical protein
MCNALSKRWKAAKRNIASKSVQKATRRRKICPFFFDFFSGVMQLTTVWSSRVAFITSGPGFQTALYDTVGGL